MNQLRKPLDTMALRLFLAAREQAGKANGEPANVILCPFSVTSAVTMLYYACEGTPANRQMEYILRFDDLFDGRAEAKNVLIAFRLATKLLTRTNTEMQNLAQSDDSAREFRMILHTKLFVKDDADLKTEFVQAMERNLHISVTRVPLCEGNEHGKEEIQTWLRDTVRDRSNWTVPPTMVDPQHTGPRAVIASTAHFQGAWETPFSRENSFLGPFKMDNGKNKEVRFMSLQTEFPFATDENLGLKMIEIPYYRNGASLVLTIPIKRNTSLSEVAQKLTNNAFTTLHMRRRMKTVDLTIPKFFIDCTYDLRTMLSHAGIKDVLQDKSELVNMSGDKTFRASEGFHKCAIQIDEDGTFTTDADYSQPNSDSPELSETASNDSMPKRFAASFPFLFKSKPETTAPTVEEFKADRPFFVAVRHNKAALFVFSGCVMCP